jgi:antitoxin component of MazEF toxin-antitoxin module
MDNFKKQIAKMGDMRVIIIPKLLFDDFKVGDVVRVEKVGGR